MADRWIQRAVRGNKETDDRCWQGGLDFAGDYHDPAIITRDHAKSIAQGRRQQVIYPRLAGARVRSHAKPTENRKDRTVVLFIGQNKPG